MFWLLNRNCYGSSGLALPLIEVRREFAKRRRRFRLSQFLQQALLISRAPVLAKLELTFKQFDLKLKADDPTHEAVLVGVVHFGEVVARALVGLKFSDQL